eukprot:TRINITY_DN108009_c0_g1_i1.p1 TRINITY_DN108009_c0_g1~~TRINITY_DN108009_c0_g1_i1.p1  ORF type:complete len:242 (-),score=11.72 TRINITY_DN108009_c0_g1_i1:70-744(-)
MNKWELQPFFLLVGLTKDEIDFGFVCFINYNVDHVVGCAFEHCSRESRNMEPDTLLPLWKIIEGPGGLNREMLSCLPGWCGASYLRKEYNWIPKMIPPNTDKALDQHNANCFDSWWHLYKKANRIQTAVEATCRKGIVQGTTDSHVNQLHLLLWRHFTVANLLRRKGKLGQEPQDLQDPIPRLPTAIPCGCGDCHTAFDAGRPLPCCPMDGHIASNHAPTPREE